jgi:hypothetical protein
MNTSRIRWKVLIPSLILIALSPAVVHLVQREVRQKRMASVVRAASVGAIPAFTLELVDVWRKGTDVSAPGRELRRQVIGQRSDGSRVEQQTGFLGTPQEYTDRVIRFSDGAVIHAHDSMGTKTSWKGSPSIADKVKAARAHLRTPESGCANDSFGNIPTVRGNYAAKGSQTLPGLMPAFAFATTSPDQVLLYAPLLGCEEVYQFTIFRDRGVDSTERVTRRYALGEPSATLFDASTLTEVSPITGFETQYRAIGWPEAQIQKQIAAMQDEEQRYKRQ